MSPRSGTGWGAPAPGRPLSQGTGGCSWLLRCSVFLQTLCLKTQGHPERYKAASRALKAISKVRRTQSRRGHIYEVGSQPSLPAKTLRVGQGGFPGGPSQAPCMLVGKPRPRESGAHTVSGPGQDGD